MKLATIDIGTHSVLLLVVQKNLKGLVVPLVDEATLTRIGEGMGSHPVFLPSGIERTLAVLKKYKGVCDHEGVEKIIAVGTAAFRKAQNAGEFVARVKKECGIEIEIISGEREAALTWKAASTDFGKDIMVVDIGGGSTEIVISYQLSAVSYSIPIGSVYLTEKYVHSNPINQSDYETLCNSIENHLKNLQLMTHVSCLMTSCIATAGTATTLGAIKLKLKTYKHNEVHGLKLSIAELKKIIADLKSKSIEERKRIQGLEPGRADVILAGSLLLEKIAEHFGFNEITVSDRGVRWGLVYKEFG